MASFSYRLENGDPVPDHILDTIQARRARLQDLLQTAEHVTGVIAAHGDPDALDRARTSLTDAVAGYREADAHLERLVGEASHGWRTIDIHHHADKPAD